MSFVKKKTLINYESTFHSFKCKIICIFQLIYQIFLVSNNKKQKKVEENGNLYERDMQSIFEKMVTRSGVELTYDDEPNKLSKWSIICFGKNFHPFFTKHLIQMCWCILYIFIDVEQALCQRNLSKAIKRHHNYPQVLMNIYQPCQPFFKCNFINFIYLQVIDDFVEGFVSYIEDPQR